MIDPLVTDCATFRDWVPALTVPHLDTEVRDMLSIVQPLHGQSVIEGQRPCEISFENGMVGTHRRGPEGAGVAIKCGLGGVQRHGTAELDRPVASIVDACRDAGLLVLSAGERVLRLAPPLIVEQRDCDEALRIIGRALEPRA